MLSKNEQKFIKSLKIKKYRTREKRFLVEGKKNVLELMNSDFEVDLVIGTSDFIDSHTQHMNDVRSEVIKKDLLTQLSSFKTNETVLAVVKMKAEEEFIYNKNDHLFYLDGVSDPGNLGTIIRTLDWFGFNQVVCSEECAEFYHPRVISSTMGSFARVKVYESGIDMLVKDLKIEVLGADMHGQPIDEVQLDDPAIIVMGSESHGLSELSKKAISNYISIPKYGGSESLNVGIATGIIANHLRISR